MEFPVPCMMCRECGQTCYKFEMVFPDVCELCYIPVIHGPRPEQVKHEPEAVATVNGMQYVIPGIEPPHANTQTKLF